MSHEEHKLRHSERRQRTQNSINKQMRIAKALHVPIDEPHKLAKHHALDCGNSDCPMCSSPRKLTGERTIQERRFYQTKVEEE